MSFSESDIAFAHALADVAGAAIRPFFRKACAIETKPDASPVTEADRAAESAMRRLIAAERPRDGIVGEEFDDKPGASGRVWVLDPIDGTRSFIAGRPIFGTLIALLDKGWPVIGVIDQPIARERWIGATGRKTLFNGHAASARSCPALDRAILATTSPHLFDDDEAARFMRLAAQIADGGSGQQPLYGGDCYNYGLLASGHIDLVVEAGLKLHDWAALVPVVEGAGGQMCDWAGEPLNADIAGDPGSDLGSGVIAVGDPARIDDVIEALAG